MISTSTPLYKSQFLQIDYDESNSLFIQTWIEIDQLSLEHFKKEMLAYTTCYKKVKPSNTIWDQSNFKLELTNEDHQWIEENVNTPCFEYGNKKCAFIVGQDVLAHISVMDSFNEIQSCIIPKHFGAKKDALKWISEDSNFAADTISLEFNGQNKAGENEFILKSSSTSVDETLKSIKSVMENVEFVKSNTEKFLTLTPKEFQILKVYGKGIPIKKIANEINISEHTARTHWRNIKRKLNIQSTRDLNMYLRAFVN